MQKCVPLLAVLESYCEAFIFTDFQNKRLPTQEHPSLTATEEEQELRELAERMGQHHIQQTKEEAKKKEDSMNKDRRKKGRKVSTEAGGRVEEEPILRKPVMETSPVQSHPPSRSTARSFQPDATVMKEQKQPTMMCVCHPAPLTVPAADCQCVGGGAGGGSTSNQEGEVRENHPDRAAGREEEQSFVII